jgi:tRNA-specific 2-thiouridylase
VLVGRHDGAYAFTVGQRRGLRVGTPAADGRPRYVLSVEPSTATVTVGPAEALDIRRIVGERPRWAGAAPDRRRQLLAQVRAHGEALTCAAELRDGAVLVEFAEPVRGVAPGQAVVLYDGEQVVGSATIAATSR